MTSNLNTRIKDKEQDLSLDHSGARLSLGGGALVSILAATEVLQGHAGSALGYAVLTAFSTATGALLAYTERQDQKEYEALRAEAAEITAQPQ